MELKEIKSKLPFLSKKELLDLQARIDYLVRETNKDLGTSSSSGLLYDSIAAEFKSELGQDLPPFQKMVRSKAKILSKLGEVDQFLKEYLSTLLQRPVKKLDLLKCYELYARLMMRYLRKTRLPLHPSTLLNNHLLFPSLLDNSFPSYIAAGFGHLIFEDAKHFDGEKLSVAKDSETDENDT